MIAYVDSSVIARALLADEDGSDEAQRLLADRAIAKVTGLWTRIEVSAAIVRAARVGRPVAQGATLRLLDDMLHEDDGSVYVVSGPAALFEARALAITREHGLRALDALHIALAAIAVPKLADKGEPLGFASRDDGQATVAASLGFESV